MDFVIIFINLIFIALSFKSILSIRNDLKIKARCTKEISVKVVEIMRRTSNLGKSEYWIIYDVLNENFNTLISKWDSFHPFNEGDNGILYINPDNKNEFSYEDRLLLKKNLQNLITIGIGIFLVIITIIYCIRLRTRTTSVSHPCSTMKVCA